MTFLWFLDAPTHLYKRLCPLDCWSVGWSVMLSLKLRKTAKFTENRCSLLERASNRPDQSINELFSQSLAQSIIHLQARAHRWPMLALFTVSSVQRNPEYVKKIKIDEDSKNCRYQRKWWQCSLVSSVRNVG